MSWPADATGRLVFRDRLSRQQKERILRIFQDAFLLFTFDVQIVAGEEKDVAETDMPFNYNRGRMVDALAAADRAAAMCDGSYIAFLDLDDEEWYFEKSAGTFVEKQGRFPGK